MSGGEAAEVGFVIIKVSGGPFARIVAATFGS